MTVSKEESNSGVARAGSDYDATRLATRADIVVVTLNYRLGIFGFFGPPRAARQRCVRRAGPAGGAGVGTAQRDRVRR
ncbi:carboxylesterase family protein [Micromonospora peucetia]|uniref:carboxylesterase family protein n=1 Tax=Micromonospora peucetia TaxID=47871 RepID=UPI00338E7F64